MTQHSETPHPTNRLAAESSPYLLQHAHNPVDWYPWGEEAFRIAREEDKPIFLSVGYSACHWCHVMERESFENAEIAALMNQYFINVKVDREERPDIDQIYMSAVQLMTQRGGWPMSVFLTPAGEPFFGGTYWPPVSRMGLPGFRDILLKIHEIWVERREEVLGSAQSLVDAIQRLTGGIMEPNPLDDDLLRRAVEALRRQADRIHGGFGGAPKFPHPIDLRILLRGWERFEDEDAREVALLTLDRMAAGGLYDHLGGGFHRYSTDARWLVPHFEKMLYDNALLVPAYLEAWQITQREEYRGVVVETLDYVLREMTHPDGGIYSTQDADSEGEEGKFFVWTEEEILDVLGPERGRIFNYCYDVTSRGNWEERNILNRPKTADQAARVLGLEVSDLQSTLHACRTLLFQRRAERVAPGQDQKVLAGWNGLMISAMAKAGRILGEDRYLAAARAASCFVRERMRDESGRLWHTWKDGVAKVRAFLDDVACLMDGLLDLFEADANPGWLDDALALAVELRTHYLTEDLQGFYFTADDHEELITRSRDFQDSATPSGNGTAALALARLGHLTGQSEWTQLARQTLESGSGLMAEHPRAAGQLLLALNFVLGPVREIVFVDGDNTEETSRLWQAVQMRFLPRTILLRLAQGMTSLEPVHPEWIRGKVSSDGRPVVYVCESGACRLPVSDAEEFASCSI